MKLLFFIFEVFIRISLSFHGKLCARQLPQLVSPNTGGASGTLAKRCVHLCMLRSHIDKWYIKYELSFPLKAVQGSHSTAPICRGRGNIGKAFKL